MRLAQGIEGKTAAVAGSEQLAQQHDITTTPYEPQILQQASTTTDPEYPALLARATNDAVRDWDVTTNRLSWPQGLTSLLGYEASASSATIGFWQQKIHHEDRAATARSVRQALLGHATQWAGEYRFLRANGTYVHVLERACIMRDELGRPVRLIGSLMDITERRQLHEQLLRSQRMEAFGQLASGVAHDFNNYLTTILGYSDLLLEEDSKLNRALVDHVSEIRRAANRASELTGQLLAFSRRHALQPRMLEINGFLEKSEQSLLRLLGENISLEFHLQRQRGGVHIRFDPGQLTQVLLNVCLNSRDAMPEGGKLTVETALEEITEENCVDPTFEALPPGEYIVVSIRDTGCGMTEEVKARLFEPFFTTKDTIRASGLGLATSYGIVRQSGGRISVESQFGQGTTVRLRLARAHAPGHLTPRRRHRLPAGTETVLVLEDDHALRHLAIRWLRSLGYEVLEAANCDDAQRLVHDRGDQLIHLLLTDVVMPKMSGNRFAEWMLRTSPATKVVFISGYLDASALASEMLFLPKPFTAEQLATKVRGALDQVPA